MCLEHSTISSLKTVAEFLRICLKSGGVPVIRTYSGKISLNKGLISYVNKLPCVSKYKLLGVLGT